MNEYELVVQKQFSKRSKMEWEKLCNKSEALLDGERAMKDLSAAQTITCHMNCKWNVNRQNASTKREAYFFQSLTSSHQKAFYSLFRQKVTFLEEKVTKLSSFFRKTRAF